MSSHRPRLVIPAGILPADQRQVDTLRSAFEVVEVESADDARRLADQDPHAFMLMPLHAAGATSFSAALPSGGVLTVLDQIGEGVGVVTTGGLTWANAKLRGDEATREALTAVAQRALERFNQEGRPSVPLADRPGQRVTIDIGETHYEAMISIAAVADTEDRMVTAVIGVLWEVTATRRLQAKVDAIDAAGAELMRIDAAAITSLNMAQRLEILEARIIQTARELLAFDNFEVRLIDRDTQMLELVISRGLTPLKIGEVIYAREEDNGISGYVAATGRSYLCVDVQKDPRYREGLDEAGSSLTIPLRLHDQVIGVLNVESKTRTAFDDNDCRFAEIFGRYIAMAMHILDLLVVQRYTTNEQVSEDVLGELDIPLAQIADRVGALRSRMKGVETRRELDRILEAATGIRTRLEACKAGPKSILGAERTPTGNDPVLTGKRVIIADNEPVVRDAICDLLTRRGCTVTACAGGTETIERLRAAASGPDATVNFDLVISDIRMPDHSGYEVFRAAKELSADLPVILITGFGYDPHHSIVRASQEGLHSFLFKPLRATQLLEAVSKAFTAV